MTRFLLKILAVLALAAAPALAQEPSPDADLERLLDTVAPETTPPAPKRDQDEPKAAPDEASKPGRNNGGQAGPAKPKDATDEALDAILEKLGQSRDEPEAKEPPRGGAGMPGDQPPDEGAGRGGEKADPLDPDKKQVDEHLEELTGRVRRKKSGQQQQDPQSGAISQTIRKIREVEKKLGENETGEQVRERQREIVKELETMIQQARKASSRSKGKGQTAQAGKPGDQPGQNPDNTGQGPPATRPANPTAREIIARAKDEWGHLPPDVRAEMENVFNEVALPQSRELIDRYYLSVNRKATSHRGDSR